MYLTGTDTTLLFRSERTRLASESRLSAVQKEFKSVTDQSEKFHEQRDKLATELKANREKIKVRQFYFYTQRIRIS